jgi:primosomal protein N'
VAGRVLVQTRHVDHFVFRHLDEVRGPDAHVAFYAEEARLRRLMQHPPYVRLVLLRVESAELPAAQARAAELVAALRRSAAPLGEGLTITGPLSAPLSRMVGRWRLQIVIRGGLGAAFRRWLTDQRALLRGASSGGVRVIVDVDPRDLL